MEGFLLIDKPAGITSHDVVDRVRRLTGERRVGHAGTLDPFATGLLIVGVGRAATREMQKLVGLDKEYEAIFVLGASSTTDDTEGEITPAPLSLQPTTYNLQPILPQFLGPIEQIPPTYSAIKIAGKKMYESARAGKPITAPPRSVTIHAFDIGSIDSIGSLFSLPVHIHCSSGTYIRSLARDLGIALGGGGYVSQLRRTSIGPFSVESSHTLESLNALDTSSVLAKIIPVETLLLQL